MKLPSYLFVGWSMLVTSAALSQTVTYNGDVGVIIREKCTACHKTGGIAPFPLQTYEQAVLYKSFIHDAVSSAYMPPWPPDSAVQEFVHARSLTTAEKEAILTWLNNDTPEGSEPPPPFPVFSDEGILGEGDLTLSIPPYKSKAIADGHHHVDDYVCFTIPSGLTTARTIEAMEVFPGDREIVHHALIYIDSLNNFPTDTIGMDCGGPQDAMLIGGYAPGGSPTQFINSDDVKMGMTIPAGANIIFALHYPEGSNGKLDTTSVRFHFYPESEQNVRQVSAAPLISNWNFEFQPGQIDTLHQTFPPQFIAQDYSVLSVFPHMHQIGTSIESYATTNSDPDTIPFIKISDWDFEWQDFYAFKHPVKLPAFSTIHGQAVYHNTTQDVVSAGLNTSDEMFLIYFQYLPYQPGDELLDVEALVDTPLAWEYTAINSQKSVDYTLDVYPNPSSSGKSTIRLPMNFGEGTLLVYQINGQLVTSQPISSMNRLLELDLSELSTGQYVVAAGNGIHTWQVIVSK